MTVNNCCKPIRNNQRLVDAILHSDCELFSKSSSGPNLNRPFTNGGVAVVFKRLAMITVVATYQTMHPPITTTPVVYPIMAKVRENATVAEFQTMSSN